jgi:aspartate aminotransferase-like enzyme
MTPCCARAGVVAACTNDPARLAERAERGRVLVGRGLSPTEGRTIRVGLPGRTATDEMVDRLLAVLSG